MPSNAMGIPRTVSILILLSGLAVAQDNYCPRYPLAERISDQQALDADLLYASHVGATEASDIPPAKNAIDAGIFRKMAADGVDAAPLTTDTEFLRRIYVDLTGRIPTYEQAEAFLNDSSPNKRDALIDSLLSSPAFVDQFSHYFLERFQWRAGQGWISLPAAINFYNYIREFVARDRPFDAIAREIISASGDSDDVAPMAPLVRNVEDLNGNPRQDACDDITNMVTTQFLGIRSECISCHNGRGHLEKINLHLTAHTRREFWKLSAFFSRMRLQAVGDDNALFRPRLIITDSNLGLYNSAIDPAARPGPRPSRDTAYEEPFYWLTGQGPSNGAWRSEFGRLLTSDRQFAKAAVNYLWAYFFASGIVDPPDGWDLDRTNPTATLPEGWVTQNTHPDVLDGLADHFIQNNYSIRSVVRLIVSSNTYQLSSRYPDGKWQDAFKRYFARHEARRMSAEQLLDSLGTATGTGFMMSVQGLPDILRYTNQLPYPNSSNDFSTETMLTSLGRGDFITRPALNKPSLYGILDFMNNYAVSSRTRSYVDRFSSVSRLSDWIAQGLSEETIVRRLFLATLTRTPTAEELSLALDRKQVDMRQWYSGLQWALVQKSDFVFNY
jgi:hypothetical protein